VSESDAWARTIEVELDELLRQTDALTPDDLWRVAVLLGRAAQFAAPSKQVTAVVDRASRRGLGRQALAGASRPSPGDLLDALDAALLEGDDPAGPLADALLDLDDLLTVLQLEGRATEAETLAAEAEVLVALAPRGPAALVDWGARRAATVAAAAPAGRLWTAVATASATAVLEAVPTQRPVTGRNVDAILDRAGAGGQRRHPIRGAARLPKVRDRLVRLQPRGPNAARAWLTQQLPTFEARAPAPVMGRAERPEVPWSLVGRVTPAGRWFRAFVVDEEYPDGYDVTELAEDPGAVLWHLERPGQEAQVVLVAASTAVPGASLAEVLDAAEQRDDVVVATRSLSRPR
jgi:hypothetical protein